MASHNEITGDALVSKRNNDNYRDNYDRIFGKKNGKLPQQEAAGDSKEVAVPELREPRRQRMCGSFQSE